MTNVDLPHRIHVLAKPTGSTCNLNCDYCFYLKKESLYPGSRFRMSDEVLEAYLSQLIAAHRTDTVAVAWQGGEPTLMGLDFFRRAVALQEKHRRPGMRFENTLQTNGTLLTDEWCAFLRANHFLVGISLDGPREIHDAHRRDKSGGPTFDRVMRGLRLLQRHGVETNVLVTVNRTNAESPLAIYRFLRDEAGVGWIQFIPAIERMQAGVVSPHQEGTSVSARSVTPEQWGTFLTDIFDEWVRRDVGRVFVQTFEAAVRSWLHLPSSGMCIFDPTCGHGLALEHNGDLYACDHFVEPSHLLGNILKTPMADLAASEQQQRFGRAKLESLPGCCRAMRGALRLPWGVSQEPLPHHSGGRTRPELPLRRLQALFRTRRHPPDAFGRAAAPRPAGRAGDDPAGPGRGAGGGGTGENRPQCPLSLRQRAQVQEMPWPARKQRRRQSGSTPRAPFLIRDGKWSIGANCAGIS